MATLMFASPAINTADPASASALNESDQAQPWAGVATNTVPTRHFSSMGCGERGAGDFPRVRRPPMRFRPSELILDAMPQLTRSTITTTGSVGSARFDWTKSAPGAASGTNVLTSHNAQLDQGLVLDFVNFRPDPAFRPGGPLADHECGPDLNPPVNPELQWAMSWGKAVCSTCHDQHSQENEPFDPAAPEYAYGAEHRSPLHAREQRPGSDVRDLPRSAICQPGNGGFPPGWSAGGEQCELPSARRPCRSTRTSGRMWCSTCHQVHQSPADDGNLLRVARETELCGQCHAAMDTQTPGEPPESHRMARFGREANTVRSFPRRRTARIAARAATVTGSTAGRILPALTNDYPNLLVEREENLCYTCHDGSPATKNLRANFTKTYKHPVSLGGQAHDDGRWNLLRVTAPPIAIPSAPIATTSTN